MNSAFPARPKKPWPSPCWRARRGTANPATSLQPQAQNGPPYLGKFPMPEVKTHHGDTETRSKPEKFAPICVHSRSFAASLLFLRVSVSPWWMLFLLSLACLSCGKRPDADTVVMIIDSSPANLDPRIGTDGSSERID